MGAPVVHFEIMGGEGSVLETFYRELFGWKMKVGEGPTHYAEVDTASKEGIPGGIAGAYPGRGPWVTFYVRAKDVAATVARAVKLGGKVVMAPVKIPDGPEIAVFEDPEGHPIGLVCDGGAA